MDLSAVVAMLERQVADGVQSGAQLYVSQHGASVLDVAVGESRPGRPLLADDLMLWYSSCKPVTVVAVLQLYERGRLGLDDRVAEYIDGFGAGKERATVRHVLTHTGGFVMAGRGEPFDADISYDEAIARIAAHPAEWEPGTRAGYHPSAGWKVLGRIVEVVDGRSIDRYIADEVLGPIGLKESRLGIPRAEQAGLGERFAPVYWTGHVLPVPTPDGIRMLEYHIERIHNEPWHIAKVEPGGTMRGPASELGRFYESLLGFGAPVLEPRTVELMGAVHRYGIPDITMGNAKIPCGLGVAVAGSLTGGVGRRSFGHNGMASSRGLADPDLGLVVAYVTNGLTDPLRNEHRMFEVVDGIYSALAPDAERFRLPARALPDAFRLGPRPPAD